MASGNDMKAANESYNGFISIVKWGSILTAATTLIVVLMIA